jgi:hypothetical protein
VSVNCDADGRYLGVAVYIFVIDIWAADLFSPVGISCRIFLGFKYRSVDC